MSKERISRERVGFVGGSKQQACRFCGTTDLPKYRRTFCSDACVDQHKIRTQPDFAAKKALERDHGICAICELDTVGLFKQVERNFIAAVGRQLLARANGRWSYVACLDSTWSKPIQECHHERCLLYTAKSKRADSPWPHCAVKDPEYVAWCNVLEIPNHCRKANRRLWELDHILPVSEGGGDCGLDNLRTLCLWCHRGETKALAARLARKRREHAGMDDSI